MFDNKNHDNGTTRYSVSYYDVIMVCCDITSKTLGMGA